MERRLRWLLGILGDLLHILLCGDPDLESSTLCANWSGLFSHCYQPPKIVWPALQYYTVFGIQIHYLSLSIAQDIRLGMRITVYQTLVKMWEGHRSISAAVSSASYSWRRPKCLHSWWDPKAKSGHFFTTFHAQKNSSSMISMISMLMRNFILRFET